MDKIKNLLSLWGPHLLILLWALMAFIFFQYGYHYHFFYQEQNQLFLWSADYLVTYFSKPAWLACMAGDFLTQFYYYLLAGPALLAGVLLAMGEFVRCALKEVGSKHWVSTVIALLVMTAEALFSLHYDYRLGSILALTGGIVVFLVYKSLLKVLGFFLTHEALKSNANTVSSTFERLYLAVDSLLVLLGTALSFWLFGYGLFALALLILTDHVLQKDRKQLSLGIISIAVPLCLLPLTKRWYLLNYADLFSYPGMGKIVKPEMDLEKVFAVDDEYYFHNYNTLVKMVEEDPSPGQYAKFYYNLVKAQQHQLPDVLLKFPDNYLGTFENIGPDTPPLTLKSINELYWTLGDMTFAERAAMLGNVCSPDNRNIRMMKRLAEINLTSGDTAAARKYLRILQKTFVWREWATNAMDALSNPHSQYEGILKTYQEKGNLINKADTLRLTDNARVLLHELVESNAENRVALDYLLCSDLLLKDMESFKYDYDRFCFRMENPPFDVKLYQEALMIYLAGTKATPGEWMKYIHRNDVMERFKDYNRQRGSALFRDTYWYYFDKATTPQPNRK